MDHDQRFKTLIREFFVEFLRLFFSAWIDGLDFTKIHWPNTELYPNPPEGARHAIDLIAEVPLVGDPSATKARVLLVHIEVESPHRTTALKPRLPYYYHFLRDVHQMPVLPIALYLKVGLDGVGVDSVVETVQGLEVNRFQYLYVGLPALDGIQYVQGDNWLGVALSALMRIPPDRVAWLGAEALRRLATAPLPAGQRFLLNECVQAYLPLDEAQKREFAQLLRSETYAEVRAVNKTVYEEGIEKGRHEERLELAVELLESRFGPLPSDVRLHLTQLSMEELRRLTSRIATASGLAELGLPTSLQARQGHGSENAAT